MVKYYSKTLCVDADFFKYGGKNLRFRKYPATCGRDPRVNLSTSLIITIHVVHKKILSPLFIHWLLPGQNHTEYHIKNLCCLFVGDRRQVRSGGG